MGTTEREPASYRDPFGHIIYSDSKVIRRLSPDGAKLWKSFHSSSLFEHLSKNKMIVETTELEQSEFADSDYPVALEHERIPFISYPYEWSFNMLKDSALLTLDILIEALKHGFTLRDGSSFNIQFMRGRPVFIDILSIAPYKDGQMWMGYAQFCRMFLFPLMLASHKGVDFRPWLRGSLEGISLDDMAALFSWRDFYKKGVLFQVLFQHYFNKGKGGKKAGRSSSLNAEKLSLVIGQLKGTISSLRNPFIKTTWGDYSNDNSYEESERLIKAAFVAKACGAKRRNLVFDIGSNTGEYSMIAEKNADLVVALDSDSGAIDKLYGTVKTSGIEKVLPLFIDVADPSPKCGWLNMETKMLAERGKPDLVIALALIHHLCIARNVQLESFLHWITGLGDEGVVEFVSKEDEMVQQMLSTREDIFNHYSKENFEKILAGMATIQDSAVISNGKRHIYYYKKK